MSSVAIPLSNHRLLGVTLFGFVPPYRTAWDAEAFNPTLYFNLYTRPQLWLITHYHPLGSLYEHLARATLTRQQMMAMAISIVNGVLHLHTEIHGTQVPGHIVMS